MDSEVVQSGNDILLRSEQRDARNNVMPHNAVMTSMSFETPVGKFAMRIRDELMTWNQRLRYN
jgi:hypothetical protein